MNFDILTPPADLAAEFASLQNAIDQDASGEKTRRLVDYFATAETSSAELQLRSGSFEETSFANLLRDAYAASRRIVLAAWQKTHGRELPG